MTRQVQYLPNVFEDWGETGRGVGKTDVERAELRRAVRLICQCIRMGITWRNVNIACHCVRQQSNMKAGVLGEVSTVYLTNSNTFHIDKQTQLLAWRNNRLLYMAQITSTRASPDDFHVSTWTFTSLARSRPQTREVQNDLARSAWSPDWTKSTIYLASD